MNNAFWPVIHLQANKITVVLTSPHVSGAPPRRRSLQPFVRVYYMPEYSWSSTAVCPAQRDPEVGKRARERLQQPVEYRADDRKIREYSGELTWAVVVCVCVRSGAAPHAPPATLTPRPPFGTHSRPPLCWLSSFLLPLQRDAGYNPSHTDAAEEDNGSVCSRREALPWRRTRPRTGFREGISSQARENFVDVLIKRKKIAVPLVNSAVPR